MFKKFMFAVVPMLMMAGTTFAGDEVTDIDGALTIDVATIAVADANVIEVGLDIDVEQLAANAGTKRVFVAAATATTAGVVAGVAAADPGTAPATAVATAAATSRTTATVVPDLCTTAPVSISQFVSTTGVAINPAGR
jgi:hypothetical protein